MIELKPLETDTFEIASEMAALLKRYYPDPVQIMKSSVKYFSAFKDGKHIGFTGYLLKTPQLAETVKTTVFEEYRGQGIGAELSVAIENECQRIGVKKVMTTIYHFNHAMISIKLRQGYTIEGYHPHHEAPGFHEYSLGKVLA